MNYLKINIQDLYLVKTFLNLILLLMLLKNHPLPHQLIYTNLIKYFFLLNSAYHHGIIQLNYLKLLVKKKEFNY